MIPEDIPYPLSQLPYVLHENNHHVKDWKAVSVVELVTCLLDCKEKHLGSIPDRGQKIKLECGPMPNVMAALSNIGGALCSTPHSLADAHS